MVKLKHKFCLIVVFRYTLPNRRELTAPNATSTPCTRFHSTRPVRLPPWPRVREDMMPSKEVSEVKPSPSSERRPRLLRRLPSSSSAQPAREEDFAQSSVARHSFLERRKRPVAPSTDHQRVFWYDIHVSNKSLNNPILYLFFFPYCSI